MTAQPLSAESLEQLGKPGVVDAVVVLQFGRDITIGNFLATIRARDAEIARLRERNADLERVFESGKAWETVLQKDRNRLLDALHRYGDHDTECHVRPSHDCVCGLDAALGARDAE